MALNFCKFSEKIPVRENIMVNMLLPYISTVITYSENPAFRATKISDYIYGISRHHNMNLFHPNIAFTSPTVISHGSIKVHLQFMVNAFHAGGRSLFVVI